jgi:hypothetical protein
LGLALPVNRTFGECAISGALQEAGTLHFTSEQIGMIASFYLMGAVSGSLFFGYLTGRRLSS